jgi:CubicO group peptidase (beta-lactamase class C family)
MTPSRPGVIAAITGKPLPIVYQDDIFRPLGLKHTWLMKSHPPHHRQNTIPNRFVIPY